MNNPVTYLKKSDQPFCENPEESFTLHSRFYTDVGIFEQEKETIFYKNWWYAGHISQLQRSGDFLTTQIFDQNIFIVRDRKNEVKAFYNVCQHRGHELLTGNGHTNIIVCPYHAWAYDFDGKLKAARNSENVKGFDKCQFSLKPVRVEVFCGLVFVNLDATAVPLKDLAGELEKEIRTYCPTVDSLVFSQRDTYEVKSNWKVMIDNFLECYHCHPAHKDFVDLVDMNSYRSHLGGVYSSHVSNSVESTQSNAFHFEKGEVDFGYAGWFLWPNLTIWAYPGEANLSILQMIPNGVGGTIEYQDWFTPSVTLSPQLQQAVDYQKNVLQPEDIGLCESVQKGLQSKGYTQGRFIIDKERSELSEHAVHHFQAMVLNALEESVDADVNA